MLENLVDDKTTELLGIDKELFKRVDNWLYQSSKEFADKEKAIYQEKRKSFEWIFEEYVHTEEFDKKYADVKNKKYYVLKNNKKNIFLNLFSLNYQNSQKNIEEKLNSQRYVELHKYFEYKIADKIMEECYGKEWNKKGKYADKHISPYHLYTYPVIFDTYTGEIIYETIKKEFEHNYIYFYDNVAEIVQNNKNTIYFDLPNRKIIIENNNNNKIETNDFIILGNKNYYGNTNKIPAKIINKHTCEITELN